MNAIKGRRVVSAAVILAATMLGQPAWAQPAPVFAPDSTPFDKPFDKWTAEWWEHIVSFPAAENPQFDSGGRCAVGQHGPVWFLAGSFGDVVTRRCTLPEGKALFIPVLNLVDINTANQNSRELRAEIAPCLDAFATLTAEVDGRPVRRLPDFRVRSTVFDMTFPEDGLLPAGTYSPVVDDGYYVMVKPLGVGEHTLHIRGASNGCPIQGPFAVDVFYHLTVVPVSLK
jgi:hypothetical protein